MRALNEIGKIALKLTISEKLRLWDTAGQERFRALAPLYFRGADAAIIVYDIGQRLTFTELAIWVAEVRKHTENLKCLLICGNKSDNESRREVPKQDSELYAATIDATTFECSALTGDGVEKIFTQLCCSLVSSQPVAPEKAVERFAIESGQPSRYCCFK